MKERGDYQVARKDYGAQQEQPEQQPAEQTQNDLHDRRSLLRRLLDCFRRFFQRLREFFCCRTAEKREDESQREDLLKQGDAEAQEDSHQNGSAAPLAASRDTGVPYPLSSEARARDTDVAYPLSSEARASESCADANVSSETSPLTSPAREEAEAGFKNGEIPETSETLQTAETFESTEGYRKDKVNKTTEGYKDKVNKVCTETANERAPHPEIHDSVVKSVSNLDSIPKSSEEINSGVATVHPARDSLSVNPQPLQTTVTERKETSSSPVLPSATTGSTKETLGTDSLTETLTESARKVNKREHEDRFTDTSPMPWVGSSGDTIKKPRPADWGDTEPDPVGSKSPVGLERPPEEYQQASWAVTTSTDLSQMAVTPLIINAVEAVGGSCGAGAESKEDHSGESTLLEAAPQPSVVGIQQEEKDRFRDKSDIFVVKEDGQAIVEPRPMEWGEGQPDIRSPRPRRPSQPRTPGVHGVFFADNCGFTEEGPRPAEWGQPAEDPLKSLVTFNEASWAVTASSDDSQAAVRVSCSTALGAALHDQPEVGSGLPVEDVNAQKSCGLNEQSPNNHEDSSDTLQQGSHEWMDRGARAPEEESRLADLLLSLSVSKDFLLPETDYQIAASDSQEPDLNGPNLTKDVRTDEIFKPASDFGAVIQTASTGDNQAPGQHVVEKQLSETLVKAEIDFRKVEGTAPSQQNDPITLGGCSDKEERQPTGASKGEPESSGLTKGVQAVRVTNEDEVVQVTDREQKLQVTDGNGTVPVADGDQSVQFTDGDQTAPIADGEQLVQATDRDQSVKRPDETQTVEVLEGDQSLQFKDGDQTVQFPDGNQSVHVTDGDQSFPVTDGDQSVKITFADQTVPVTDGEYTAQNTDVKQTVQVTDGYQTVLVPCGDQTGKVTDGDQTAQVTVGDQTTQVTDGVQTVQVPDGVQTVQVSDGDQTTQNTDENQTVQVTDGVKTVQVTDGVQTADGVQTVQVTDGDQTTQVTEGGQTGQATEGGQTGQATEGGQCADVWYNPEGNPFTGYGVLVDRINKARIPDTLQRRESTPGHEVILSEHVHGSYSFQRDF